jgi:hypothetical protein
MRFWLFWADKGGNNGLENEKREQAPAFHMYFPTALIVPGNKGKVKESWNGTPLIGDS